jgi:DNA processing protein
MHTQSLLTLLSLPQHYLTRKQLRSIHDKISFNPANLVQLGEVLEEAKRIGIIERVASLEELQKAQTQAERTLQRVATAPADKKMLVLGAGDTNFPAQLQNIPNAPVLLYLQGNIECLSQKLISPAAETKSMSIELTALQEQYQQEKFQLLVAVIGSRKPSSFGLASARRIAARLAEKGVVVVSGLAIGCDTSAHQGCLSVSTNTPVTNASINEQGASENTKANVGKTVAVLGHGLDVQFYPQANVQLAQDIVESGGCLVTEYGFGVRPKPGLFLERDRLISGLVQGLILIEGTYDSGSMRTIEHALEQNNYYGGEGACGTGRKLLACLSYTADSELAKRTTYQANRVLLESRQAQPLADKADIDQFLDRLKEETNATTKNKAAVTGQLQKAASMQITGVVTSNANKNEHKQTQQLTLF